jgi:hypothetical protein
MAGLEMSKRTSVAKNMREQIGELRLGMRASLGRRKRKWYARKRDQGTISCERDFPSKIVS